MKQNGGYQSDHSKATFFNDGNHLFMQLVNENLQFHDQGSFQMKYINRVTQINVLWAEDYLKIVEEKSAKFIHIQNAYLRVVMNQKNQQFGFRISKNGQQAEFYGTSLELIENIKKYVIQSEFQKKYQIIEKIGSGNLSSVYKIQHSISGQMFAAKIVKKSVLARCSKFEKDYFLNEISILRQIDHDNLLKLEEIHEGEQNIYIITELLEGGTIKEEILNNHFKEQEMIKFMHSLFNSLYALHKNNIYHNDIRYDNILLRDPQDLKTACFINYGKAMQIPSKNCSLNQNNHQDQERIVNLCIKRDIYSLSTILLTVFTKKVYNLNQVVDELLMKNFQYITQTEYMELSLPLQRFFEMIFTDKHKIQTEFLTCEKILGLDIFRILQKPRNSQNFVSKQQFPQLPRRMSKFVPCQSEREKLDNSDNSVKLPPINRDASTSAEKSLSSSPKSQCLLTSHLNTIKKKNKLKLINKVFKQNDL
ncbi:unnamed protein product (macronuclear) [Paramecium tetraurelia]|uniref:Protein kinase domain-containing protein n=1 Tax=Paramecium tetraurelia TaxID=5888 RepID=A0BD89_PARTE|nr:uncharacterized protein GSPATT00004600001 [Paramecium tetraurelia]CAK56506.1 unnamed protein product [Paramecium tetraurelia]|eukprot:XP_001423904.1 hypothetical protein (macronuclear) [Paramecium tetraurelia strain d4-2]